MHLNTLFPVFMTLLCVAIPFISRSQDDFSYLKNLSADDSATIDALILYPKEARDAMLEASLYPQALVRLNGIQKEFNKSFMDLMSPLPKEEQEKFWDVVRWQGLVKRLAEGKKISEKEIKEILKDYPEEIHETALYLGTKKHETLVKIHGQENAFIQKFQKLTESYPASAQNALSALVEMPEVLSIMQDNISLVLLAGEAYRKNPEFIRQKADSMSLAAARQHAENVKAWTETLEKNPEAAEQLKQSAQEYAKEYGYDERDYAKPQEKEIVEIHHYYNPYPYWCGYPWWYPRYWWYPYPYWYHWGFYYGSGGITVIGMPSYFFVSWYFHYPIHHYYYPHLSDAYIRNAHYGPRRSSNTVARAVDDWRNEQGDKLPPNLLNDDAQRVARLRDYGKFEEDFARHNLENPAKPVDRQTFYQKNEKRYPDLNIPRTEAPKTRKPVTDEIYERRLYPTKKEIEDRSFDRKWDYPERRTPDRKFFPDRQAIPQRPVEPQRRAYPENIPRSVPQNAPQPERKFIPRQPDVQPRQNIPQKPVAPQRQTAPQQRAQPDKNIKPR